MKTLSLSIAPALGEIIHIKYNLDFYYKDVYDTIQISFGKWILNTTMHVEAADWPQKKIKWDKYLDDIGRLLFSEPPYKICDERFTFYHLGNLIDTFHFVPQRPKMACLCKGISLKLDSEYIVITTKVRAIDKNTFYPLLVILMRVLSRISKKYKIVILGERKTEIRKEYGDGHDTFSIYDNIIANIPNEQVVDLTVPSLGETVSDLKQIQQDCLIMNEAAFVITLGIGGNFCMAMSTAKMIIGFRNDSHKETDMIYNQKFTDAIITKEFNKFIDALESYI